MKLFYLANIRMPTEKAHGLQIMQMCEAFAQTNAAQAEQVQVTLIAARRITTGETAKIQDPWAYYGVAQNFSLWRCPCIDLMALHANRFTFTLESLSYTFFLMLWLLFRTADIYYSRDVLTLLVLSLFKPRERLVYEAHTVAKSGLGRLLQQSCATRVSLIVALTGKLADDLKKYGARRVITAHDGFRADRFANLPDLPTARTNLGLPADAFIVGYTGRLQTMSMSKGIDTVIAAIAQIPNRAMSLCLVGGPDDMAAALKKSWLALGLPEEHFILAGHVSPSEVPAYIRAFDVCVLPLPFTEHFAYYASSLKLFEYMASGKAILTTDLPAISEVLHDEQSALLVPPSSVAAFAIALERLYDDPELRQRLSAAAQRDSSEYSWQARADRIIRLFRDKNW